MIDYYISINGKRLERDVGKRCVLKQKICYMLLKYDGYYNNYNQLLITVMAKRRIEWEDNVLFFFRCDYKPINHKIIAE